MNLLLDLSMKDKSLYLQFNDVNKDDKISENIHNIFLNYDINNLSYAKVKKQ